MFQSACSRCWSALPWGGPETGAATGPSAAVGAAVLVPTLAWNNQTLSWSQSSNRAGSWPQWSSAHSHLPSQKLSDLRLTFHDTSSRPQLTPPHSQPEMIWLQTDLPWCKFHSLNWLLPTPSWKWFDCRLTFHDTGSCPQLTRPHTHPPSVKCSNVKIGFLLFLWLPYFRTTRQRHFSPSNMTPAPNASYHW